VSSFFFERSWVSFFLSGLSVDCLMGCGAGYSFVLFFFCQLFSICFFFFFNHILRFFLRPSFRRRQDEGCQAERPTFFLADLRLRSSSRSLNLFDQVPPSDSAAMTQNRLPPLTHPCCPFSFPSARFNNRERTISSHLCVHSPFRDVLGQFFVSRPKNDSKVRTPTP